MQLLGSITDLKHHHRGCHAIVGSHGGLATGYMAVEYGVASIILHDAGIGFERAGIAALAWLGEAGIPAATVAHDTARIGDPQDMRDCGRISWANGIAASLGVVVGQDVETAHTCLSASTAKPVARFPKPAFIRQEIRAGRQSILLCDSASLIQEEDAGRIVVTGSHGGAPGGDPARAIKAPVALAIFNDAGVGKDQAGIARLGALDASGIPAACVDCMTARIGEARSTYDTGVLSHVNATAAKAGLTSGQKVRAAIDLLSTELNEA